MTEYKTFLWSVVTSAGTTAVLTTALGWLFRTWIAKRLTASVQHKYDARLAALSAELKERTDASAATLTAELKERTDASAARLKATFDRESEKLKLASQSFGEVQKASLAKRLEAVEKMWKAALYLSDSVPAAVTTLDVLTEKEILEADGIERYMRLLAALDHEKVNGRVIDETRKLAEDRPYVGEVLWSLYATYHAITFRTIYLVDSSKQNRNKRLWHRDRNIQLYIKAALGESTYAEFEQLEHGRSMWLHDKFARKILQTMDSIIAGRDFGVAALQQAEMMETRIREANLESQPKP
jgi:hypothetical protein